MEFDVFGLAMDKATGAKHWKSNINLTYVIFDAIRKK